MHPQHFSFPSMNLLIHKQLTELTFFLWCVVTRNRTSASKSLGTLSTNSWWDTRKYTILRAKVTSKLASHSLRKIVGVNMFTTLKEKSLLIQLRLQKVEINIQNQHIHLSHSAKRHTLFLYSNMGRHKRMLAWLTSQKKILLTRHFYMCLPMLF